MAKRERKFITKTGENLMKYFVFIISILVAFSGSCSSSVETNQTANGANATAPNTNPANANLAAATNSNPPGMQPYSGNINPNAFNQANDNLKVIKYEPKKDELPYGSRVAPDDSIITSGSRGTDFVETRTFKNHAVLAKVEKIMDGKTEKYKVYLKNGKVFDAPGDKMKNMQSLAPENILDAIGMLPKPQTNQPTKPEEKKDQKP
jgi:hypothetical protein